MCACDMAVNKCSKVEKQFKRQRRGLRRTYVEDVSVGREAGLVAALAHRLVTDAQFLKLSVLHIGHTVFPLLMSSMPCVIASTTGAVAGAGGCAALAAQNVHALSRANTAVAGCKAKCAAVAVAGASECKQRAVGGGHGIGDLAHKRRGPSCMACNSSAERSPPTLTSAI